jgi:hypothetical protein
VKSEVPPAKKRKRGTGDGDEDVKHASSDHVRDASVLKKKKEKKRSRDVAKIFERLQPWFAISVGTRVTDHLCALSQAAERRLRRMSF